MPINYIHTYIHNWQLQPFSHDYGTASHTNHVVCVNFIRKRRDLQFNGDSEQQIFEKLFLWHTCIVGHYNPSVRIIDLFSHTTHVVCINFKRKRQDLQFNGDSEQQVFEKLFSWHTRIIGYYNPSVKIIDLVSHTSYVVCIDFIHKWCIHTYIQIHIYTYI